MSHSRARRSRRLRHIVVRRDGAPTNGLDPDCPFCAMLAADGWEADPLDGVSAAELPTALPGADGLPLLAPLEVAADQTVARLLGTAAFELMVPAECRARELVALLGVFAPPLRHAAAAGGLEVHVDGFPLAPDAPVVLGRRVTLVAVGRPERARA